MLGQYVRNYNYAGKNKADVHAIAQRRFCSHIAVQFGPQQFENPIARRDGSIVKTRRFHRSTD